MPILEPFEPLATRAPVAPAGPAALVLEVGDDHHALRLEDVRVVVEAPDVTRVPDAPPAVLGVLNVRGEVVPVLDTGIAAGVAPVGGAPFAVVVEAAPGRVALAARAQPRHVVLGPEVGASALAVGTHRHAVGDGLVATLLDVDALALEAAA
ncbi:chemotaxis protein CheW [Conexibacter sp. SYSU D00693]|uniref:chemotaxis protein CheW n=1 Tax=Conexibacter sp. SYSU D00693 TaxID=2812560 RepID=UPI00196B86FD|nr:chemotaxis protein CheW [Conexibacter sp. SYSU D00693]